MITYFPLPTCWLLSHNMQNHCLNHSAPVQNKNSNNKHRQGPVINKNKQRKKTASVLVEKYLTTLVACSGLCDVFFQLSPLCHSSLIPSSVDIQLIKISSFKTQLSSASLSHFILLYFLLSVQSCFPRA